MADDTIDPRAAKLLGDLLALVLSENESQAEAAIGAIRRRAARDAVTGGALKHLANQLLGRRPEDGPSPREITEMRWTIADQRREMEQTRHAQHRAESALGEIQRANHSLADSIGRLRATRSVGARLGFLAGLVAGGLCFGLYSLLFVHRRPEQTFDRVAQAELADYLHNCFLSSSNSLAGAPFALHLLVDVDADGRITAARIAPDQAGQIADPDQRIYGSMVVRTLDGGSCGSLPLPASLRGKSSRLDLNLPR